MEKRALWYFLNVLLLASIVLVNVFAFSESLNSFVFKSLEEHVQAFERELSSIEENNSLSYEEKLKAYENFLTDFKAGDSRNKLGSVRRKALLAYLSLQTEKNIGNLSIEYASELDVFGDLDAQHFLGDYFSYFGDYEKASDYYRKAFLIAPYNAFAYQKYMDSLEKLGDSEARIREAEIVFAKDKRDIARLYPGKENVFDPANVFFKIYYLGDTDTRLEFDLDDSEEKAFNAIKVFPATRSGQKIKLSLITFYQEGESVFEKKSDFSDLEFFDLEVLSGGTVVSSGNNSYFIMDGLSFDFDKLIIEFEVL